MAEELTPKKSSDYALTMYDMRQGKKYLHERNVNQRYVSFLLLLLPDETHSFCRLLAYAENRRKQDARPKHRPTDRFLHLKPSKAIMQLSEFQFRNTFGHWYMNVEYDFELI
jgi:hypothetical protein